MWALPMTYKRSGGCKPMGGNYICLWHHSSVLLPQKLFLKPSIWVIIRSKESEFSLALSKSSFTFVSLWKSPNYCKLVWRGSKKKVLLYPLISRVLHKNVWFSLAENPITPHTQQRDSFPILLLLPLLPPIQFHLPTREPIIILLIIIDIRLHIFLAFLSFHLQRLHRGSIK